jgi:hypothetical protein
VHVLHFPHARSIKPADHRRLAFNLGSSDVIDLNSEFGSTAQSSLSDCVDEFSFTQNEQGNFSGYYHRISGDDANQGFGDSLNFRGKREKHNYLEVGSSDYALFDENSTATSILACDTHCRLNSGGSISAGQDFQVSNEDTALVFACDAAPTAMPTNEPDQGRWLDNRGHLAALVIVVVVGFLLVVGVIALMYQCHSASSQPSKPEYNADFTSAAEGPVNA